MVSNFREGGNAESGRQEGEGRHDCHIRVGPDGVRKWILTDQSCLRGRPLGRIKSARGSSPPGTSSWTAWTGWRKCWPSKLGMPSGWASPKYERCRKSPTMAQAMSMGMTLYDQTDYHCIIINMEQYVSRKGCHFILDRYPTSPCLHLCVRGRGLIDIDHVFWTKKCFNSFIPYIFILSLFWENWSLITIILTAKISLFHITIRFFSWKIFIFANDQILLLRNNLY